jgi:GNAT superfamily N-acetyltransferase
LLPFGLSRPVNCPGESRHPARCGTSISLGIRRVPVPPRRYTLRMLFDDLYFHLESRERDCALESEEPSFYLYSTHGTVVASNAAGSDTSVAGRFHLYYVDVCAALNAGESIFDIFDSSAEILDYYCDIFEPCTVEVSAKLQKLFKGDAGWGNVLILNRLELLPEFRSHNLGLIVMRRLIERFGAGAFLVAIKPFPLQCERPRGNQDEWETKLQLADFDKDLRRSTAKLHKYYKALGFKAMKGTPFMFRLADDPLPSPRSLKK